MVTVLAQLQDSHGDQPYLVALMMNQSIAHNVGARVNSENNPI
jgi:hypothetical protein